MTPKRKAAHKWFRDRTPIECREAQGREDFPGIHIVRKMLSDGQLRAIETGPYWRVRYYYSLTDEGYFQLCSQTSGGGQ